MILRYHKIRNPTGGSKEEEGIRDRRVLDTKHPLLIRRATCSERVYMSGVGVSLKK